MAGGKRLKDKTATLPKQRKVILPQQETATLEGEARFRLVLQNTSDIITVFDRSGRISYQSPSIGRILGREARDRIGANIFDSALVHPGDKASKRRFLEKLVAAKPRTELKGEFRLRHADGSYRDIEAIGINMLHDPSLSAVILSSRDVTDRKAAERALMESEANYALTFNEAPIGIAHTAIDGRWLLVNQHFCDILGYSRKELLAKTFQELTHPDDLASDMQALEQFQSEQITNYHREKRYIHKNGSIVWVNLHVAAQRDKHDAISYFLITVEDITERKRAETAAKAQHELEVRTALLTKEHQQLIAINKAKDEFISLASHQLRTPATGVKQYVGMLLEGYAEPMTNEARHFLQRAYACNERQLKIVDAMLNVARLDAGKVRLRTSECDLSSLLADIIEEQRLMFNERNQTVVLDKPARPVMARVDERLLRMAMENFIDNASKYSPEGKPVTVRLRRAARKIEIAVSDHGVGISKKHQVNLFQKFSRVDNPLSVSAGGSGLGLYWAKKIIDLHHGTIELVSKLHQGSTFTVKLP